MCYQAKQMVKEEEIDIPRMEWKDLEKDYSFIRTIEIEINNQTKLHSALSYKSEGDSFNGKWEGQVEMNDHKIYKVSIKAYDGNWEIKCILSQ